MYVYNMEIYISKSMQCSINDKLCVSVCVYDYLYNSIYQPLRSGRIWHKVNF